MLETLPAKPPKSRVGGGKQVLRSSGKGDADEKSNVCFNGLVGFYCFGICPEDRRSRWWHDGWWLGLGNELRMDFCRHYRLYRYFWYRLYDEAKVVKGEHAMSY